MPFTKGSRANSSRQAPMPGPNSPAYKKLAAARKALADKRAATATRKRQKSSAAFSSLKSRQMIVERVKRAIWASVLDINEAIINLALAGNYMAAKALFDFAGVYTLPAPEDSSAAAAAPAPLPAVATPAPVNQIDAFFRSIGIESPIEEPLPNAAA